MSIENVSEIDYTPRMIEYEHTVEIGGFFSTLGKLKRYIDESYEKYGDIRIVDKWGDEYFIENPITKVSRLETEDEVLQRIAEEEYDRQHAVETIDRIAQQHGLKLKWE